MNIAEIDGIGTTNAATLERAGIGTTEALLERGASAAGRAEIAGATGISAAQLLTWVNHADLMRIRGVGSEYSDLLEAAGVDSPAELAHRNAANLVAKIQETVHGQPGIVRRIPTESEVSDWIDQAKTMPKVVTHGSAAAGAGAGATGSEPMTTSSSGTASATASMPAAAKPETAPAAKPETAPAAKPETAPAAKPVSAPAMGTSTTPVTGTSTAPAPAPSPAPPMAPRQTVADAPPSRPPTAAAPSRPATAAAPAAPPASGGVWARIKRMFGRG